MRYLATITEDLINEPDLSRHGDEFWDSAPPVSGQPRTKLPNHKFRLIDDDGVTYYKGQFWADDEGYDAVIERLYDWGQYDVGTTVLEVDGKVEIG